ncbi:hypothetical protein [Desulfobacter curvatus]|uniref:hypothetical protein n=1 Tax=Desulfobacter curvatus TaxID=2290 RepID=UPI000373506F|nr:hypothetical protein [Desulfobacter curvatus]
MDNRIITAVTVFSEQDRFSRRRDPDWVPEKGFPDEGEKGARIISTTRPVFHIYLPRVQGTDTAEPESKKSDEPHRGTETVLLVEDEVSILFLLKTVREILK